jgi:hypothetical protein
MSDLGLLSKQYQQLHEFLHRLRRWTTTIKQVHFKIGEQVDESDVIDALNGVSRIATFLRHVIPKVDEGEWDREWILDPPLPVDVVERIREIHSSNQSLYIEQLQKFLSRLQEKPMRLTDKDIDALDEIMLAASADINEVFRRMMRWV